MTRATCALLLVLTLFCSAAHANALAVVDAERVFRESLPGQTGEAHLTQVRNILQKGLDDLRKLYQGKENTAEAAAALREGQAALERQFAAERQAVRQVLAAHLENAIRVWFAVNAKSSAISAVAPASAFFVYSPTLDVTLAVIEEMNKAKPTFRALPSVTVQAPSKKAGPQGGIGAPARPQGTQRSPQ
jgi:Skp family chaperone for outer membrane proteins